MSAIVTESMPKTFFFIDIGWWRSNWRICKRIIGLLRPYWLASLGAVVSMVLATVAALVVPWLLAWVIDVGIRGGQFHSLLLAAAAILLISALRGFFSYGQSYLSQAVSCQVAYDLRNQVYDHLQRLDFSFHDDAETGQLMSRLTVDIEGVRNFIPLGLLRALVAIVTFGAVAILLLQLDIFLALITLISVPLLMVLAVQVGKRLRPLWEKVQQENGVLGTIMQESLSGMRVVKSFAREPFEVEKYDRQNRKLRELNLEAMRLSAWNQPLMVLVLNLITVLLVWVGA